MRITLFALGFLTVVSFLSFFAMLFMVDPVYADRRAFAVFYVSLFAVGTSLLTWFLLVFRSRMGGARRPMEFFLASSIRHAALLSAIGTASLLLETHGRLSFLTVLAVIAAAFFLEKLLTHRPFFRT